MLGKGSNISSISTCATGWPTCRHPRYQYHSDVLSPSFPLLLLWFISFPFPIPFTISMFKFLSLPTSYPDGDD